MKLNLTIVALSVLMLTQPVFAKETFLEPDSNGFSEISFFQIPEFHQVNPNIYRGGYPQNGDLVILLNQVIKTIINIDNDSASAHNEQMNAESLGITYIFSPMSAFNVPSNEQVDSLLNNLQDPSLFPIFIHCKHGQDRTVRFHLKAPPNFM